MSVNDKYFEKEQVQYSGLGGETLGSRSDLHEGGLTIFTAYDVASQRNMALDRTPGSFRDNGDSHNPMKNEPITKLLTQVYKD